MEDLVISNWQIEQIISFVVSVLEKIGRLVKILYSFEIFVIYDLDSFVG